MKRVVSVSLGSKSRDHQATIELLGETIQIERIGTDGDMVKAKQLYEELDGKVDCLGVGGAVLSMTLGGRTYVLDSPMKLIAGVKRTPVVDGEGVKNTVERRIMQYVEQEIGAQIPVKRAMITSAVDRWGMALSLQEAGYEMIIADLMFVFGLPIPMHTLKAAQRLMRVIGPLVTRLPMSMLYPTGAKEDVIVPKFERHYQWASVIAGDCNYVRRHIPAQMPGKVIVTNTTTATDVQTFRERGVKYLVTSTPRLGTRTFGTNVLEAAITALAGKGRPLTLAEIEEYVQRLGLHPHIERLN